MTRLRGAPAAAIMGAGLMGQWHARAAVRAGGRIALVIDDNPTRRAALARNYAGCDEADTGDVLSADRIDVLHVCTPDSDHAAAAGYALSRGIHVIVEKPMAATAGETGQVLAIADSSGRLACPVHQFVFQRGFESAMAELPRLGTVLHVDMEMCTAGADVTGLRDDLVGSILCHSLSVALRCMSASVATIAWRVDQPLEGELRATGASGATSISILISTHGRPTRNSARLICSEGTIFCDFFHGFSIVEDVAVSRAAKIMQPFRESSATFFAAAGNLARRALLHEPAFPGLNELVARFYDSVKHDRPSPIAPSEVLDVAAARDRILGAGQNSSTI